MGSLSWLVVVVVTLGLGSVIAIAIDNWRAKRAIIQARAQWAAFAPRNLIGVKIRGPRRQAQSRAPNAGADTMAGYRGIEDGTGLHPELEDGKANAPGARAATAAAKDRSPYGNLATDNRKAIALKDQVSSAPLSVSLRLHQVRLEAEAKRWDCSPTSLAHLLILDGLMRLESGEWQILEGVTPSVELGTVGGSEDTGNAATQLASGPQGDLAISDRVSRVSGNRRRGGAPA